MIARKHRSAKEPPPQECTFELLHGGITVASVSGFDRRQCFSEIMHYAMMYAQDGPCVVREVGRLFEGNSDVEVSALISGEIIQI